MSTISTIHKIQITKMQTIYKLLYYKPKEITNISTRVTRPAEEVSSNILPPWDVFHSKGVLLYRYGPPEHSVVLVRRVL